MLNDETELKHYGILRRSGRYPWGSGENPYQRGISFRDAVHLMSQKGMSEAQIAKAFGMNTAQFRATKSISNEAIRKYEDSIIQRLKNKGVSNVAIAERLDISEAKVRARLQRMDEPIRMLYYKQLTFLKRWFRMDTTSTLVKVLRII